MKINLQILSFKREQVALIENFINIESKIHVIIRVLHNESITFKIKHRNEVKVEEALLKKNNYSKWIGLC